MVAVIVAAKWANFGLSVSVLHTYFCIEVSYWCCGGSLCSSRWHTPVAHIVLVMVYNRFVWSGVNVSTRRKVNLMQLVMYYLVHKYIDILGVSAVEMVN